jgi:hypothetical protein
MYRVCSHTTGKHPNRRVTFVLILLMLTVEFMFAVEEYERCHARKDFGCR